ncbi:MAG TPA: MFS transporter [Burkholderiales bacterium]|nr:MFS transporter [Burkholderiales bacterium]
MLGRGKLHYAWIVAAVTFVALLVGGATRATPSLLIVPLESEFQWSRATISFAIGVNILLYGLIGPFAAAMMESFGVRRMMLGALTAIGVGVALTPFMQQSWQLVLLWGVVVGAGSGIIANVLAATIAARWFTERRGLVMGLLTSSAAAGQLLFLPLLAAIIAAYGWRPMSFVLAAIVLLLFFPVAKLMRERPQDVGLAPYGEAPGVSAPPLARPGNPVRVAFAALGTGLRSRDFWLLAGSFFVCGASTNGLIGTHLIAACSDKGMSEVAAASMLAMMAIFNFVGATGSGWLSDRMDNRVLLAIYYGLRGLSLLLLPFAFDSFYMLGLFIVFYGLDWIATVPPTVRLTANAFGKDNTGIMFGWISASHQLGGATAAYLAGVIRVDLGNYTQAFIISGALCFVAAVMVMFIGRAGSGVRPVAIPALGAR